MVCIAVTTQTGLELTFVIAGYNSFETDGATFSSAAATIHQSGRSTPHSFSSDNTIAFEPNALYAPGIQYDLAPYSPGTPGDNTLCPTLPATNRRHKPSLLQQTLLGQSDISPLSPFPPASLIPTSSGQVNLRFPCWYCAEENKKKEINTKQDWKRHMQDYHYGTGQEWHCAVLNCRGIFHRGKDFKTHFNTMHKDIKEQLDKNQKGRGDRNDLVVIEQHRRVYACGHEDCGTLNYNWKAHCDHAALCIQKGVSKYSYNRMIRVLLKHHNISRAWKNVYTYLCPQVGITPSQLQWDPNQTRDMRRRLEYHDFGPSLEDFLVEVFWLGNQNNGAKLLPAPGSNFLPLLPSLESSEAQSVIAPFAQTFHSGGIPLSAGQTDALHDTTGDSGAIPQAYTSDYRNSTVMLDAPSLIPPQSQADPHKESGVSVAPENELVRWQDFVMDTVAPGSNITPPVSQPDVVAPFPMTRRSSKRGLMRKSVEWLRSGRSPPQQSHVMDHPDLPAGARMPTSSPRKTTSSSPRPTAPAQMCSLQS